MELTTETVLRLLLAANVVLLGAAGIAMLRFKEQAERFTKFWDSPAGVALAEARSHEAENRKPLKIVTAKDPELENKVAELQTVVRSLASRDQAQEQSTDSRLPIENAVRMARHGATIEELIRSCGLNIGEAQLMRKLHGKAAASAGQH